MKLVTLPNGNGLQAVVLMQLLIPPKPQNPNIEKSRDYYDINVNQKYKASFIQ
jgi:hypothetical protein